MNKTVRTADPTRLMATSLIALVPVAIVFFLCERYVMRGLGVLGERKM